MASIPPMRLYEMGEKDFDTNGLCCLLPSSAELTQRLNEAPYVHLVQPIENSGVWAELKVGRIIYVPYPYRQEIVYQPFRIYKMQKIRTNGGAASIAVDARHVFNDIAGTMVTDLTVTDMNGQEVIDWLMANPYRPDSDAQASDEFTGTSDITNIKTTHFQNQTFLSALSGDDASIATVWGGNLHVDHFRFSINSQMEGARNNAFILNYNISVSGVTATYDTDNTYNVVVGTSNLWPEQIYFKAGSEELGFPHDKVIYVKLSYDEGATYQQYINDLDAKARQYMKIRKSYQVTFADISSCDAYSGFANIETLEIGDSGEISDDVLGITDTQKIIEKKIDLVTMTTTSAVLGDPVASILR